MKTTDEIIREYKDIYFKLYGTYPSIGKNSSWIFLNLENIRRRELVRRKNNLLRRLRRKEEENRLIINKRIEEKRNIDVWNSVEEKDYFTINIEDYNYSKYIKNDLIKLFLDKILELCNNSVFDMERLIKDFISGDRGIIQSDCYNCRKKIELETRISEYKSDILRLKSDSIMDKNRSKVYKNQIEFLEKQIRELRENSVLFSMNDLKYQNATQIRKWQEK